MWFWNLHQYAVRLTNHGGNLLLEGLQRLHMLSVIFKVVRNEGGSWVLPGKI